MTEQKLKKLLKLCTPNQLKKMCDILLIDEFFPILEAYYLKRIKLFAMEYKFSMSKNALLNSLKFCRRKILNALNDEDLRETFEGLLNIKIN